MTRLASSMYGNTKIDTFPSVQLSSGCVLVVLPLSLCHLRCRHRLGTRYMATCCTARASTSHRSSLSFNRCSQCTTDMPTTPNSSP